MVRKRQAIAVSDPEIARILHVMAHPARLQLLNALRDGEECVCHLTALLGKRQAYVSQQLMLLREVGLLDDRKESLRVYYHIRDTRVLPLLEAVNAMRSDNTASLDENVMADCPCPRCRVEDGKEMEDS